MISERDFKEAENLPSRLHHQKLLSSEQKASHRMKASALGDVKNVLHSRPQGFSSQSAKPSLKSAQGKQIMFPVIGNENPCQTKCTSEKIDNSVNDQLEENDLEFHNHFLCEQADEICVNSFLCEYKCSDKQIEAIGKMGKTFNFETINFLTSLTPCVEIEGSVYEDRIINADDMLDDFALPEVPGFKGIVPEVAV